MLCVGNALKGFTIKPIHLSNHLPQMLTPLGGLPPQLDEHYADTSGQLHSLRNVESWRIFGLGAGSSAREFA